MHVQGGVFHGRYRRYYVVDHEQLPQKAQNQLIPQLKNSNEIDASPTGGILMGMHILEYVGFAKHVDQLLSEEHTSIEKLKEHYRDPGKSPSEYRYSSMPSCRRHNRLPTSYYTGLSI